MGFLLGLGRIEHNLLGLTFIASIMISMLQVFQKKELARIREDLIVRDSIN